MSVGILLDFYTNLITMASPHTATRQMFNHAHQCV